MQGGGEFQGINLLMKVVMQQETKKLDRMI